ncbi:hypothetical protein RQP46_004656 [Phenoliferia psychrophenolica]
MVLLSNAFLLSSFASAALAIPFTLDSRTLFTPDKLVEEAEAVVAGRGVPLWKQVVVFGDSLSDGGKGAWEYSNHTWPADRHYFGHRFSNGHVYAEDIATGLNLKLLDYAVGGATTNNTRVAGYTGPGSTLGPVPSVLDQARAFAASKDGARTAHQTLFIVYGGANDAFFDINTTAEPVVESLKGAVKILRSIGATHFLVPSLPPLGSDYPFTALVPSYSDFLGNYTSQLRSLLLDWAKEDEGVKVPDFFRVFKRVFRHPERYGFDPDKVDYHPSKRMHGIMASAALKELALPGW